MQVLKNQLKAKRNFNGMGDDSARGEDVQLVIDWWQRASLPVGREGLFTDMPALQVATLM